MWSSYLNDPDGWVEAQTNHRISIPSTCLANVPMFQYCCRQQRDKKKRKSAKNSLTLNYRIMFLLLCAKNKTTEYALEKKIHYLTDD